MIELHLVVAQRERPPARVNRRRTRRRHALGERGPHLGDPVEDVRCAGHERAANSRSRLGIDTDLPDVEVLEQRYQRREARRQEEGTGLEQRLTPATVETVEGDGCRRAGREPQLVPVDHAALHRDRERRSEHAEEEDPERDDDPRLLRSAGIRGGHGEEQHRRKRGDDHRSRRVARRRCGRDGAVRLEDRHRALQRAGLVERAPDGIREDARGQVHAQEPARLQPDVDVGEREEEAEHAAGEHRTDGELRCTGAVGACVPLGLVEREDVVRRDGERLAGRDFLGGPSRLLEKRHLEERQGKAPTIPP